jgi:hypothetical protein
VPPPPKPQTGDIPSARHPLLIHLRDYLKYLNNLFSFIFFNAVHSIIRKLSVVAAVSAFALSSPPPPGGHPSASPAHWSRTFYFEKQKR